MPGGKRKAEDGGGPRITEFQERLYAACKSIPKGRVTTYGTLAKVLSSSARAVGQGMRHNPFAPVVPCHRVVAADMQLGGFNGQWGNDTQPVCRKRVMLQEEGVVFDGTKVSPASVVLEEEMAQLAGAAAMPRSVKAGGTAATVGGGKAKGAGATAGRGKATGAAATGGGVKATRGGRAVAGSTGAAAAPAAYRAKVSQQTAARSKKAKT
ncbi:hypothetical protein FOA52_004064 [Chlamydomonas sp. UWO 241]|nr:hypothetical protein FOA52_004064 [Chlamydomonas sp. UWO 241]